MKFRIAEQEELEKIFEFWNKIFDWENNRVRILKNYVAAGVCAGTNKILLMEDENGKLAGSVLNVLSTVFYDDVILKKASVGEVSIDSALQGRGLGHKLMEENQKFLESINVDFARLGGLTKFYSRFGYVSVPTKMYEIILLPISGGVKKISVEDLIVLDKDTCNDIRELKLPDELSLWVNVHNEFHRKYFFSEMLSLESQEYWRLRSNPNDNIRILGCFDANNNLSAYIVSWGDAFENIVDMGYSNFSDCVNVLKFQIKSAMEKGAKEIRCAFADEDVLRSIGLKIHKIETLTQTASTMISIVKIEEFFRKVKPILERRLAESPFANVRIKIDIKDIGYEIILNEVSAKQVIEINVVYQDLIFLLFNYKGASEIADKIEAERDKSTAIAVLTLLFPYSGKLFASL